MALADDFKVHTDLHLSYLKGAPSGMEGQFAEVSTILSGYDAELAAIHQDPHLSPAGKDFKMKEAYTKAQSAVEAWHSKRTTGIDEQTAPHRRVLEVDAGPQPTDLQVQHMISRLQSFDPLEVEVFYADASDAERRVMESASAAIGRQPVKQGERLMWQSLLSEERVAAGRAARAERANPQAAQAVREAERIRNTYTSVAGAANGLLRGSVPGYLLVV